nr:MAG TPA: minor tail protein [Caudoviricetes sp.]
MATRTIATRLTLEGEKEFKKQMGLVNGELRNLSSEMQLATAEFKGQANSAEYLTKKSEILKKEIDQQEEKVRALTQAVEDSAKVNGDVSAATDKYRQQLNKAKTDLIDLNDELSSNERYLDEARTSADKCAKSIDEYGKQVKDAAKATDDFNGAGGGKGGIGDLIGQLGSLKKMLVGGAVVAGLKATSDAIIGIVDETEEYRKIMGTLEASSQAAGYTAEQTAESYEYLYGVLGDHQQTATTIANLQAIGLAQDDLNTMLDAAIGAWGTYGDSVPIDSLSEAINETIQTAKVTGVFADALNWAGVSEDEFNEKLAAATSQAEIQQLVIDQFTSQNLPAYAKEWRDANEDIVAYNESQLKLDEAMGELGETLAPVAAGLKDVFAEGVYAAADAVAWLIEKIQGAIQWLKDLNDRISNSEEWKEFTAAESTPASDYQALLDSYKIDGSHAAGLYRVPYDGYVAELHRGERVLTSGEADAYNALERYGGTGRTMTAQDFRASLAQAVNAMAAMNRDIKVTVVSTMNVNGKEFYRETIEDLRTVNRSTPEVGETA